MQSIRLFDTWMRMRVHRFDLELAQAVCDLQGCRELVKTWIDWDSKDSGAESPERSTASGTDLR